MSDEKPMGQLIQIDEAGIRDHLGEMVRGTVEEALNAMLEPKQTSSAVPAVTNASQARQDTRAAYSLTISFDRDRQIKAVVGPEHTFAGRPYINYSHAY
jgi:putative transposase